MFQRGSELSFPANAPDCRADIAKGSLAVRSRLRSSADGFSVANGGEMGVFRGCADKRQPQTLLRIGGARGPANDAFAEARERRARGHGRAAHGGRSLDMRAR